MAIGISDPSASLRWSPAGVASIIVTFRKSRHYIIKYRFSSELLSSRSNRTVTNDIVTNYTAKFVS